MVWWFSPHLHGVLTCVLFVSNSCRGDYIGGRGDIILSFSPLLRCCFYDMCIWCYMSGRFTGRCIINSTLVLPSLNRKFPVACVLNL